MLSCLSIISKIDYKPAVRDATITWHDLGFSPKSLINMLYSTENWITNQSGCMFYTKAIEEIKNLVSYLW